MSESITSVDKSTIVHKWTIENFSFWLDQWKHEKRLITLCSPRFTTGYMNKNKWKIKIELNGKMEFNKDWLSVHLFLESSPQPEVRVQTSFFIIDAASKEVMRWSNRRPKKCHVHCNSQGSEKFCTRQMFINSPMLWPEDKLTIGCRLTIYGVKDNTRDSKVMLPPCNFINNYKQLYESKECSDVVILVGDKAFQAHKAVLVAHSPVFLAMFRNITLESQENQVNISDIEPEIFEILLKFIYTNETPQKSELTTDLLAAADKYELERLKRLCEKALCDTVTVSNAAEQLITADLFVAKQLKNFIMDFIEYHKVEVVNTPAFSSMAQTHPQLMEDLYRRSAVIDNQTIRDFDFVDTDYDTTDSDDSESGPIPSDDYWTSGKILNFPITYL